MKRTIKLKSIKDSNIVEFVDGGVDKEGEPTGQRQALSRVLGKRVAVTIDGKESNLPIFLVHHVGEWTLFAGETMPTSDAFVSFEQDVIHRDHSEAMLERWSKAQAQFIAESVESRRQAEKRLENEQATALAGTMRDMMRAYSNATPANGKKAANV